MMKKYTRQMSAQDEGGVKVEHQISRQYSRQQSNPDTTATPNTPTASKKEETKEAEEEVRLNYF